MKTVYNNEDTRFNRENLHSTAEIPAIIVLTSVIELHIIGWVYRNHQIAMWMKQVGVYKQHYINTYHVNTCFNSDLVNVATQIHIAGILDYHYSYPDWRIQMWKLGHQQDTSPHKVSNSVHEIRLMFYLFCVHVSSRLILIWMGP